MTDSLKLAVLGGSSVASPELVRVLARQTERPPVEIVLLGRTPDKLEKVAAVSARLAASARLPVTVRHTTDERIGLQDADYVLNQVRIGGYQARAYDESFPHAFGLPGEETYGPGGMNNALRTIPVTLQHCRLIEQVAPNALLINLTNPSSYIQYAVSRYSRVNVVGVCDSPVGLVRAIADLLGAPVSELWAGYIGMHHFGWVTEVRWKGRDVMPELLKRIEDFHELPVDADIVRAMGAIPSSYFKYYYHPERMLARQQGKPTRAEQLLALEDRMMQAYSDPSLGNPPQALDERGAHWYEEIVVPVLLAHANDSRQVFTLNVTNGTAVNWLPAEAIVEMPVLVTHQGFYPLQSPHAPPDLQAMVRRNAAFEMLWVEAVVEQSHAKALRAMSLNHLVQSLDQAKAILKTIWPRR